VNKQIFYLCLKKAGGQMEIKLQLREDIGIITFSGKTLGEPADSKRFEQQLNELLERGEKKIVLDLTEVQRINSTGLAILITATTLYSDCGEQKIVLAGSNDFINGALAVTKLNQFFEIYDTLDEALQQIKQTVCE